MDRRDFLKASGAGAIGLAALPMLENVIAPRSVAAIGHLRTSTFTFVAVSKANTLDKVAHTVVMSGYGSFSPSGVEGGGGIGHFDFAPPAPKPVVAAGTWTAKRMVNYAPYGVAGPFAAGILDLDAEANITVPSPSVVPFKLRIVCNLGPAAILTGQPEGFFISIPGTPFVKGGVGGQFVPFHPELGLTAFTPGAEVAAYTAAWEEEFRAAHGGRAPSAQDRADRLWSTDFIPRLGRGPTDAEWQAHWSELQAWWAT